jgi:hypothetical protein
MCCYKIPPFLLCVLFTGIMLFKGTIHLSTLKPTWYIRMAQPYLFFYSGIVRVTKGPTMTPFTDSDMSNSTLAASLPAMGSSQRAAARRWTIFLFKWKKYPAAHLPILHETRANAASAVPLEIAASNDINLCSKLHASFINFSRETLKIKLFLFQIAHLQFNLSFIQGPLKKYLIFSWKMKTVSLNTSWFLYSEYTSSTEKHVPWNWWGKKAVFHFSSWIAHCPSNVNLVA